MKERQVDVVLQMLQGGHPCSTWELAQAARSLAVHSRVNDLRRDGHDIRHWEETRDGRRVHFYRLVEQVAA
jgi:predicted transcriptional regulator